MKSLKILSWTRHAYKSLVRSATAGGRDVFSDKSRLQLVLDARMSCSEMACVVCNIAF